MLSVEKEVFKLVHWLLYFGVEVECDYAISTEQKNQTLRRDVGRNCEKVLQNCEEQHKQS